MVIRARAHSLSRTTGPRTRALRLAAALAAAGTATLGLAAPARATGGDPLDYVALGDSFSAGSGVLPLDPTAPLLCARSTANYPHVVAKRTGARLTDVTCGGAQTKDFAGSQYPGVAPQLDAVDADTDVVTLTIGGNDNNTFISAILACGSAGVLSGGKGSPCKDANGDSFTKQIDANTYPALKTALRAVKAKAPHARVGVLGYPWIVLSRGRPRLLRQDADRHRGRALPAGPAGPPEQDRAARRLRDGRHFRRHGRRLGGTRRLQAAGHALDRARAVRHELRPRPPERPRRVRDGRPGHRRTEAGLTPESRWP